LYFFGEEKLILFSSSLFALPDFRVVLFILDDFLNKILDELFGLLFTSKQIFSIFAKFSFSLKSRIVFKIK
jgi:hypothetical protein